MDCENPSNYLGTGHIFLYHPSSLSSFKCEIQGQSIFPQKYFHLRIAVLSMTKGFNYLYNSCVVAQL